MPRFVVLGGTGMMGRVVVRDLYESSSKNQVILAGSTIEKATQAANAYGNRVAPAGVDVTDIEATAKLIHDSDVVINCVQYYYNLHVMQAALLAGTHYIDLGGLFHVTLRQLRLNRQFEKENLAAVLGMGSTPGITNVLAAHGAELFDSVDSINIKIGARDFSKYVGNAPEIPYSLATLMDEFTLRPAVFRNGKMKFVNPRSGRVAVNFPKPIGRKSALLTLHSELATFPKSFAHKKIKNVTFRVAFEKKFVDRLLGMSKKKRSQTKPSKPTVLKLEDYECLRVELEGKRNGKTEKINVDCIAKSNRKWNASAGDIDTGTPPSIVAQMIEKGQIKERGAFAPEYHVQESIFFKELEKRGMKIITG